jgi:hypothetical protein
VSPAGRISASTLPDSCDVDVPDLQLVDAGVTDNSALGTLSDLAPQLSSLIRETNAKATGEADSPFVIPVIVFVSNERGSNVLIEPSGARPELLVPPAALLNAPTAQVSPAAWLNRLSVDYADVCGKADSGQQCRAASEEVRTAIPGGIAVVAPATAPAVSVPLGWTLSSFSQNLLAAQALEQAACGRDAADLKGRLSSAMGASRNTGLNEPLTRGLGPCTSSGEYGMYGSLLNFFR